MNVSGPIASRTLFYGPTASFTAIAARSSTNTGCTGSGLTRRSGRQGTSGSARPYCSPECLPSRRPASAAQSNVGDLSRPASLPAAPSRGSTADRESIEALVTLICTIRFTPAFFAHSNRVRVLRSADSNVWPSCGKRIQYVLIQNLCASQRVSQARRIVEAVGKCLHRRDQTDSACRDAS